MAASPAPSSGYVAAIAVGAIAALGWAVACAQQQPDAEPPTATPPSPESTASTAQAATAASSASAGAPGSPTPKATRDRITIIAGGDVSFARLRGQLLLKNPGRNDFAPLASLLDAADLRFVNLESQISDQQGQTVSPINKLVFVAPPAGADVLRRGHIDVVSVANNHMWDYGQDALLETMDHLDRVGVAYVGASRAKGQAFEPVVVERHGFRVAFIAVTGIWNQGRLRSHPALDHVADADPEALHQAVRAARARDDVDAVIVSYHGGDEYVDTPHEATRALLRAAVEAGADAVLGHHPHVLQRIEMVGGRPIFYSIGNLLMRMTTGKPWTEWGLLARVTLRSKGPPEASVCPFRISGFDPVPLAGDPHRKQHQAFFRFRFERLLRVAGLIDPASEAVLGPFDEDGCATVRPRAR